jgi:glycosyltransferase involved in cell wall biosynthesis
VDRTGLVSGRRLAIVSHTPHHRTPDGLVGWGPTVTELDHLATRFDSVVHVAPVHDGPAPASSLPYTAPNLEVLPVRAAGGDGWRAKAGIPLAVPGWLLAMHRGTSGADVLHVRCPANLSGLALAILRARRDRRPLWVKYAGNWRPDGPEPWSYRTQRRWLRRGWGTVAVTVNGEGDDPPHVRTFPNPSLTDDDLAEGAAVTTAPLADGLRLAFVGRVEPEKGAVVAARVAAAIPGAQLTVVGDGPDVDAVRAAFPDADVRGWLPRHEVHRVLADAHVLLLPSRASEGWPKVLSEAMAYGAVPVASAVSSVPQVFARTGAGVVVDGTDPADHVAAVQALVDDDARMAALREAGREAARRYTFGAYLAEVDALFADRWGIGR